MFLNKISFSTITLLLVITIQLVAQDWKLAENPLYTEWGEKVTPENAWQEYPRPMMVRDNWENLNGLWDFKINQKGGGREEYNRKILVPYPVESALSGIKEEVGAFKRVWYRRNISVDNPFDDGKVLLHFGAVDWEMHLFINDHLVGEHQGGYDPFTFDITDYLTESGEQKIVVTAWDPTDLGKQPVGKQSHDPRSIWYTANTGIWQTVWLEYVPATYIKDLKITPQLDLNRVKVEIMAENAGFEHQAKVTVLDDGQEIGTATGYHLQHFYVEIDDPKTWSPTSPFLYDLQIALVDPDGNQIDEVESYFGMRKIEVAQAEDGYMRLFLNNEPLFHMGPLDQGWWPDGLYTAASDEALKYDVQITKDLGFNMLRKHVKVEPQRFYYWCDKIGIMVWQDMPSGDMKPRELEGRSEESDQQFRDEYKAMIDAFYNHPSIVMWVPFNEGWGQYNTADITAWTQNYDPSRLVNSASGWFERKVGDVKDMHRYPGPDMPETEDNRAAVLGEFGGQALVVDDHLWLTDFSRAPGHYKTSTSQKKLRDTYAELIRQLYPMKEKGLAAAVYTQTSDVETEVNGLVTYDRKVIKFDPKTLQKLHGELYK